MTRNIRPEKKAIFDEIKSNLEKSNYLMLFGYRGASVEHLATLRRRMKGVSSRVMVVQNSFVKRVAEQLGKPDISKMLEGPTAMVTGQGDVVQVAKLLKQTAGEISVLIIRGGLMDGKLISGADINTMSNLPSKEELIGKVVCTVAAPLSSLVGVMKQKISTVLYVLKAIEEKKSK